MKIYTKILFAAIVLAFCSCTSENQLGGLKDFVIQPEFEAPMIEDPLLAIEANDGYKWTAGEINGRIVSFQFRSVEHDKLAQTPIRMTIKEESSMITPRSTEAVVDLREPYTVQVSNGYGPENYVLRVSKVQLLRKVSVTIAGETLVGYPDNEGNIMLTAIAPDVTACEVELDIIEDVEPITPSSVKSVQNLENPFEIRVKDKLTGNESVYTLKLKRDWFDVTYLYMDMLPDFVKVYKTEKLHDREGNVGYMIKIPAGKVSMESSFPVYRVQTWYEKTQTLGEAVQAHPGAFLFTNGPDVNCLKPVIRNLVINSGSYALDADGAPCYGWYEWNIKYYTCPPTLGVVGGKASIEYAEVLPDGKLYKFAVPQYGEDKTLFTGGQPWIVTSAVSGYAMPLKDNQIQISSESHEAYRYLANIERNHSFNNVKNGMQMNNQNMMYQGEEVANLNLDICDGMLMARNLFGVTEAGDLFLFVSERYSQTNNSVIEGDDQVNGSTLREAAVVMQDFGCTDALAMFQVQYAAVTLQDGNRGTDITRTVKRTSGSDLSTSLVVMFKDPTPNKDDYGDENHAGGNLPVVEY